MLPGWQPDRAIDTLKLAKLLLPGRASYGLQSIAKDYDLAEGLEEQCDGFAHTSAYDALLAARLLFKLLELRPEEDREYLLSSAAIIEEPRQGSLF
jgi:DNA polymerase III epsilon subunit-like protein